MGDAVSHGAGEHGEYHPGDMDVREHKATFDSFMSVTVWSTALIVMGVAALTAAFAMGAGWFAGVAVWAALGVATGVVMKMSARWWGALIGTTVTFVIGGALAGLIAALA